MEDKNIIKEENLDEVSAGRGFEALKEELLAFVPEKARVQLASAVSDNQVCKILADNGVDLEKLEKKIKSANIHLGNLGEKIKDNVLANVSGGYQPGANSRAFCRNCSNENDDEFSKQMFVTLFVSKVNTAYRCKKCGSYIVVYKDGSTQCMSADQYHDEIMFF